MLERKTHRLDRIETMVREQGKTLQEESIAALVWDAQLRSIDLPAGQNTHQCFAGVQLLNAAAAQLHKGAVRVRQRDPGLVATGGHIHKVVESQPVIAGAALGILAAVRMQPGPDDRSDLLVPDFRLIQVEGKGPTQLIAKILR